MEPESKKIMGFIDPKWAPAIGIGAGLALLGGAAYYFFSKSDGSSRRHKHGRLGTGGNESNLENNSIITNLANSLLHETQQYSMQTLKEVMLILEENACEDYCLAIMRSRELRRRVRDTNFEQYCSVIQQELDEQDEIISDVLNSILKKIGGNLEVYQNSVKYWADRDQDFAIMQMTMAERWKLNLKEMRPEIEPPTIEQVRQMYEFDINTYPRIQIFAQDPDFTLLIKKAILHDLAFEKFGYEDEDRLIDGIGQDKEVTKLVARLQKLIQHETNEMLKMLHAQRHPGLGPR